MKDFTYQNDSKKVYRDAGSGWVLQIDDGAIHGLCDISLSTDPGLPESVHGCRFLFRTQEGVDLEYKIFVGWRYFWPPEGGVPKEQKTDFRPDFFTECMVYSRDFFTVTLDMGRILRGRFKNCPIKYAFMIDHDVLWVQTTVWVVDPSDEVGDKPYGWETFYHAIPVQSFLWQEPKEQIVKVALRKRSGIHIELSLAPIGILTEGTPAEERT